MNQPNPLRPTAFSNPNRGVCSKSSPSYAYPNTFPDLIVDIKKMKDVEPLAARALEPKDRAYTKPQLEHAYESNPDLLRDMDSNHDKQIQSLLSYH